MNAPALNITAVCQLSLELLRTVQTYLASRPIEPGSNLEALNALAIAVAPIFASAHIKGPEVEDQARAFFQLAIDNQVLELIEQARQRERAANQGGPI